MKSLQKHVSENLTSTTQNFRNMIVQSDKVRKNLDSIEKNADRFLKKYMKENDSLLKRLA